HCYYLPILRQTSVLFLFHVPATTEIYTLSLHDALPIFQIPTAAIGTVTCAGTPASPSAAPTPTNSEMQMPRLAISTALVANTDRSEEHTSELQSRGHLVCRLLLEKKIQPPAGDLAPPVR